MGKNNFRITKIREVFRRKNFLFLQSLETSHAEGIQRYSQLKDDGEFMIGLGLYWGEGYKKGNNEVGFSNSDIASLLLMKNWFDKFFDVDAKQFVVRVSINESHADRVSKIEKYWSEALNIPFHQFTKTSLIKTALKKTYENHDSYYGVLRIKINGGTKIKHQILGMLDAAQAKILSTPKT